MIRCKKRYWGFSDPLHMALHHGLTQCMITWGTGVLLCCLVIFFYGPRRPSNQLGGLSIGPNLHPNILGTLCFAAPFRLPNIAEHGH